MFENFRIKKEFRKAYAKLILPEAFRDADLCFTSEFNRMMKKKRFRILRISACFSLALVSIALFSIFGNSHVTKLGGHTKSADNAGGSQSFTLVAYAVASKTTSNESDILSLEETTNNSVTLKYNTSITLPSGQIFPQNRPMYGKVDGKTLYEYNLPNIIFHFTGENIKGVNARAESGILYDLGNDQSNDIPIGPPVNENKMIPQSNYMKWTLNMRDIVKIISSPDFTDFESLPPDALHFNLTYNNGETQKVMVAVTFGNSGKISCTLK